MDLSDLDETVLERCLQGIRYPVTWTVCSHGTQLGSGMRHAIRRLAARWHAQRYHAEHGRLPEGTHRIVASVSTDGTPADLHVSFGSDEWVPRFEADITFPPPPAELVPLLRRDPERSE
jgi:hypothetical protein